MTEEKLDKDVIIQSLARQLQIEKNITTNLNLKIDELESRIKEVPESKKADKDVTSK